MALTRRHSAATRKPRRGRIVEGRQVAGLGARELRGVMVRVGADQSYGKANAPIRLATGEYVYVPIPERAERVRIGFGRPYSEIADRIRGFVGGHDIARWLPSETWMHLDPDFEHLTYGDNGPRRGSRLAALQERDFIAFYASLLAVDRPATLVYALIGFFTVERIVAATELPEHDWHLNAHTRRSEISQQDIVVFGAAGSSGRLERAIPIGEFRDRAYRVRRDLLNAWGGLSVMDGYIQRSAVPPYFTQPARFLAWFSDQQPSLIPGN